MIPTIRPPLYKATTHNYKSVIRFTKDNYEQNYSKLRGEKGIVGFRFVFFFLVSNRLTLVHSGDLYHSKAL